MSAEFSKLIAENHFTSKTATIMKTILLTTIMKTILLTTKTTQVDLWELFLIPVT